jgi:hypothetical protein
MSEIFGLANDSNKNMHKELIKMKTLQYIKKTVLAALCSTITTVAMGGSTDIWDDDFYGQPLETVESVITALNSGAIVNAAVDLSKCTRQDGEATTKIRGGLMVSPYQIKEDGTLSFSDSHFTVTTMFSGNPDPIMQFLRYSVSQKGAITVTSFIYTIPDYTLTKQVAFDCSINNGVNFNATY